MKAMRPREEAGFTRADLHVTAAPAHSTAVHRASPAAAGRRVQTAAATGLGLLQWPATRPVPSCTPRAASPWNQAPGAHVAGRRPSVAGSVHSPGRTFLLKPAKRDATSHPFYDVAVFTFQSVCRAGGMTSII